jgi:hypothetical protein
MSPRDMRGRCSRLAPSRAQERSCAARSGSAAGCLWLVLWCSTPSWQMAADSGTGPDQRVLYKRLHPEVCHTGHAGVFLLATIASLAYPTPHT